MLGFLFLMENTIVEITKKSSGFELYREEFSSQKETICVKFSVSSKDYMEGKGSGPINALAGQNNVSIEMEEKLNLENE